MLPPAFAGWLCLVLGAHAPGLYIRRAVFKRAGRIARAVLTASSLRLAYLVEAEGEDRVLPPVLVVVVPPLGLVDGEAFGLHRGAQKVAQASLLGGAARVVYVR